MAEHLSQGLPPEALGALKSLQLSELQDPEPKLDKTSLKDAPYVDALDSEPALRERINSAMSKLAENGLDMPVLHVTSRAIRRSDGGETSSGYLESIASNGFRARDTNVAGLMRRDGGLEIASPEYFSSSPHKLLRALAESLNHYIHHGSRTNKESMGAHRDTGVGIPALVVIDATGVPLIPGSDYDDHYLLGENLDPSRVMGVLDLGGVRPNIPEDVAGLSRRMLELIESYQAGNASEIANAA